MSPQPSSSRIAAVRVVFVVAMCVCTALARPEDAKIAEKKPVARAEMSSGAPAVASARWVTDTPFNPPQNVSVMNVSEDMLDKALGDRRFVQRQLKCATGEAPCDPIGRKLKAHAPLVMRGMCVKCSPSEIKQIQRVMSHIQKEYPKEYAKILKQYQTGF